MSKATRRHLLKGIGASALLASFPGQTWAEQHRHFWPGSRIGITAPLPDFMYPYAGDPYNLRSRDDNAWEVTVAERPAIDALYDAAIWDRKKYAERDKLLSTRRGPGNVERRLFARMTLVDYDLRDLGGRTLVMRDNDWFGEINLLPPSQMDDAAAPDHWSTFTLLTNSIFNSLVLRRPVSLEVFLAENGLEMDLAGLNPRHFASHLMSSLEPPASPHESYFGGKNHITMKGLPTPIPFSTRTPSATARRERIALLARGTQYWRENNGIGWYRENYPDTYTGEKAFRLIGFGVDRWLTLDARAEPNKVDRVTAALEQLALSTSLLDKSFANWGKDTQ